MEKRIVCCTNTTYGAKAGCSPSVTEYSLIKQSFGNKERDEAYDKPSEQLHAALSARATFIVDASEMLP